MLPSGGFKWVDEKSQFNEDSINVLMTNQLERLKRICYTPKKTKTSTKSQISIENNA